MKPSSPMRLKMAAPQVSVATDRFMLRSLRPSDASERYLSWIADPDTMTPLNMPARELSLAELKSHIASFDQQTRLLIGMFEAETRAHFGVFLVDVVAPHRLAKLQYLIGEREFRGIGALRECARGLIRHLFEKRSIEKVAAQVTIGNDASMEALKAIGFRVEGEMKGEIKSFQDGSRLDQVFFGLLRDEWRG